MVDFASTRSLRSWLLLVCTCHVKGKPAGPSCPTSSTIYSSDGATYAVAIRAMLSALL